MTLNTLTTTPVSRFIQFRISTATSESIPYALMGLEGSLPLRLIIKLRDSFWSSAGWIAALLSSNEVTEAGCTDRRGRFDEEGSEELR
jgi:hypothetical protein